MSEQVNLTIEQAQPVSLTKADDTVNLTTQTPSKVEIVSSSNQNSLTVSNDVSSIFSVVNQGVQVTVELPTVVNLTTGSVQGSFNPIGAAGGALAGSYPDPTLAPTGVTAGVHAFPSQITVQSDGRISGIVDGVSGGTGDKNFVYQQSVASSLWVIAHNLGKKPSVTVEDTAGSSWIVSPNYIDDNNLTLQFSNPFSGYAYLN